ncbi:MAG TPA: protein kinase [Thermoanaerobaculia bacterium]|nr:protein kinase [Thermoanaerobaculia bacterium]
MTSLPESLGPYRILSLIGAGGMGEVYLADDTRLARRVAIKILPDAGSRDSDAKRRMLREARAVAALDHPNVCTIYEVGEHDGRPYIVMQYIEGETLFERLEQGRLAPAECFDIAMQVCSALDEAHSHGVVHRDIKPPNIVLTPRGQVKVLDFGLAKFAEPMDGSTDVLMSRPGVVTGTAPYMSPEQLRGAPVDGRTDIFSLGVVMYEMATGFRPFDRDSAVQTITAILFEDPAPIRDEDFAPLGPIIRRALAKEPAKRYATAAMFLEALRHAKNRPVSRTRKMRTEEMAATRAKPTTSRQKPVVDSVAVVAFADEDVDYVVQGLVEGIASALSDVRRLRVVAPSTARYASDADPRRVAKELNVAAVVGVRARTTDADLHVDVDLISAADGSSLFSSKYTRPARHVAALAESIATDLSERLRARGATTTRRAPKKKRSADTEAQHLYLKGRFQWIKRHPEAVKQAINLFQLSVEQDPMFALPYAGLADAFVMLGFMQALPPREVLPKLKAAARRAIELDPNLPDPHATLGYAAGLFEWDWETAQRELEEAMRISPNYPWAPHWLGLLSCGRGETRRGLELIELGQSLDPLSPIINIAAGIPLYIARRYDDAIARYRAVLETETSFAPGHYYLAMALEQRGDHDEAVHHHEKTIEIAGPAASLYMGALAHSYALAGRTADAERIIGEMLAMSAQRYVSKYNLAIAYSGLHRIDDAFAALEEGLAEHNAWLWFLPVEPRFNPLRDDARFAPMVRKYGLEPVIETDG